MSDGRIIDLTRAGLASSRYVCYLDFSDGRAAAAYELDQVPFADLGVVQVEHQLQRGAVDRLDERETVRRFGERRSRVVDGSVEVFEDEGHSLALTEAGDPGQGLL